MIKKLFRRIRYLLFAGDAIDALIRKEIKKRNEQIRIDNMYRLDLCRKHRQEPNRSEYSTENCHYCQAERELAKRHDDISTQTKLLAKQDSVIAAVRAECDERIRNVEKHDPELRRENEQLRARLRALKGVSDDKVL